MQRYKICQKISLNCRTNLILIFYDQRSIPDKQFNNEKAIRNKMYHFFGFSSVHNSTFWTAFLYLNVQYGLSTVPVHGQGSRKSNYSISNHRDTGLVLKILGESSFWSHLIQKRERLKSIDVFDHELIDLTSHGFLFFLNLPNFYSFNWPQETSWISLDN